VTLYERIPGGTIEAVQWTGSNQVELNDFTRAGDDAGFIALNGSDHSETNARLFVAANGTWLPIEVGEWVAKDSLGFYPIKDEVFRKAWREPKPPVEEVSGGKLLEIMGTDAMLWATEFDKRFTVTGGATDDDTVGLMLGWFANALGVGFEQGRQYGLDPKNKEVDLDSYTNNSNSGDGLTVRVGDLVEPNFAWRREDPVRVTRIFKPTPKSRVVFEFETVRGGQAIPARGHAHYYGKVSNG
jgi:hypothetical protein